MKTLYVNRPVENFEEIHEWYKNQNVDTSTFVTDPHCTICYSSRKVDWNKLEDSEVVKVTMPSLMSQHEIFPFRKGSNGKILVLSFTSSSFQRRHQYFKDRGASFDFPNYQPHISLTTDDETIKQMKKAKPYQGLVVFGPEIKQEVKIYSDEGKN